MGDWFDDGGSSGQPVDVQKVLDSDGGVAIGAIVQLGALVSLSTTRDGGALGVTVTVDGRYRRQYFRNGEDLTDWMAEALPAVRQAMEAQAASSERGTRQRRSRGL